ncbi:MAG: MOSC domain-containing protein [Rhodobacterales bacterium]|nr:MOSC domain-containing protein [Rhodobacterales bacterium]
MAPSNAVVRIQRFPVKGLGPEDLRSVDLTPGEGLPEDRRFAIAHDPAGFDRDNPAWLPKTHFLMLARNEKLAALETQYDAAEQTLTILRHGRQVARGRLTTALGRAVIEDFFSAYMKGDTRGKPTVMEAPGHMFSDLRDKVVSLINLETLRDLERVTRQPVDPLRFRGNIIFDGHPAWREFDWVDRDITIGEVTLRGIKRIERCAATTVNPETAERDLNIPKALKMGFGHTDCGLYARVTGGGTLRLGNALTVD